MTGLSMIPPWRYWACTDCGYIHPAGHAMPGPCTRCGADSWTTPPTNEEADS